MMAAPVYLQPAIILQLKPYRETSLLLDVFTRDFGIVPMLAKAVRQPKSKLAGVLQPFLLLQLSYLDNKELKLLTGAELQQTYSLQQLGLYCGFYVNELLQKLLHKHDPYPELFADYQHCLQALAVNQSVEASLRYFELNLLLQTGYQLELDWDNHHQHSVQTQLRYDFIAGVGMMAAAEGMVSGHTLLKLSQHQELDSLALAESKRLLRTILDAYLQGQSLHSREVLAKMRKYL
ncbi:DNA repair protein RecO [Methylomonas paludis]|uniref:DNA repair protein RecO n=1 Tax=Methylomonas paludis TaxID=1173101 RepID=A0A975MKP3_9GAMM|nr:DNA repair protein RecO [Methylomonas paludis]QWF69586.1 DNA repair protein RecO [Methylomonas paludis]